MTTACIRHLTEKYVTQAKSIYPELFTETKYSPHSYRHSKAVHMIEAGVPLIYIRNFLGRATIQSTERYARVSNAAVSKALTERKLPKVIQTDILPETSADTPLPAFLIATRQR
jgi:site-specific recombinase XerD